MAWTYVGNATANAAASSVAIAYTPAGGYAANSLLVMRAKSNASVFLTGCTDSLNNSWYRIVTAGPTSDSNQSTEEVWFTISAALSSGSTLTVTITQASSTATIAGRVVLFTGNATSTVVDTTATGTSISTGTALSVSPGAVTTNAGELAVAFFGQAIGDASNWTIGTGWTSIAVSTNSIVEYQIVTSAATSVTGTGTGQATSDAAPGIIVFFNPSGITIDPFPASYGQINRQMQNCIYRT